MGSVADEEEALSDFEEDHPPPVELPASVPATTEERLAGALAELDLESRARKKAEEAKAELQYSSRRLKIVAQEAVRQREEALRHRKEALRLNDDISQHLKEALQREEDGFKHRDEAIKQRDDAFKQKDEMGRQKEEASKARDSSTAEIDVAARLLVAGAARITGRANSIKSFSADLPQSSTFTGIAAIAYGFTKRAEEIVDEIVRQQEAAVKSRTDLQEQMEQHNYQIAIEVSQLHASIQQLKDEVREKSSELENSQTLIAGKAGRISSIKQEMLQKLGEVGKEAETFKEMAQMAETKVKVLESKMDALNPLFFQLFPCLLMAYDSLVSLSGSFSSQIQITTAFNRALPPNHDHIEQWLQECLNGAKAIADLSLKLGLTWKEYEELRKKERVDIESDISRLVKEKKEVTNFLRNALAAKQESLEAVLTSQVGTKHKLLESQSDSTSNSWADAQSNIVSNDADRIQKYTDGNILASPVDSSASDQINTGEAISMASSLENEIKTLRQEKFELQQMLAVARGEVEWLRIASEGQAKELHEKLARMHELEGKEEAAMRSVESLIADLAATEEEISRWKEAAMEEAAAGASVLEELERCREEISVLERQVAQLSRALEEAFSKMRSKEEMAAAAIVARNAAERSLQVADERARELRERMEEMSRHLEELEGRGDKVRSMGKVEVCWPLHWLRGRSHYRPNESGTRGGAEMEELLEHLV